MTETRTRKQVFDQIGDLVLAWHEANKPIPEPVVLEGKWGGIRGEDEIAEATALAERVLAEAGFTAQQAHIGNRGHGRIRVHLGAAPAPCPTYSQYEQIAAGLSPELVEERVAAALAILSAFQRNGLDLVDGQGIYDMVFGFGGEICYAYDRG